MRLRQWPYRCRRYRRQQSIDDNANDAKYQRYRTHGYATYIANLDDKHRRPVANICNNEIATTRAKTTTQLMLMATPAHNATLVDVYGHTAPHQHHHHQEHLGASSAIAIAGETKGLPIVISPQPPTQIYVNKRRIVPSSNAPSNRADRRVSNLKIPYKTIAFSSTNTQLSASTPTLTPQAALASQ